MITQMPSSQKSEQNHARDGSDVTILIRSRLAVESAETSAFFCRNAGRCGAHMGQSVPLHSECLRVDTVSFDIEINNDLVAVIVNVTQAFNFAQQYDLAANPA